MEISRHVQVPFDPAKTWHFHVLGRWTSWWPHEKQDCCLHSEFSFGSSSQFLPEKCSLCVLLVQVPVFFGGGQCSELFVLYLIYSYICAIKRLVGNQTWQSIQHHCLTEKKTRVSPCESFTINTSTVYACMLWTEWSLFRMLSKVVSRAPSVCVFQRFNGCNGGAACFPWNGHLSQQCVGEWSL